MLNLCQQIRMNPCHYNKFENQILSFPAWNKTVKSLWPEFSEKFIFSDVNLWFCVDHRPKGKRIYVVSQVPGYLWTWLWKTEAIVLGRATQVQEQSVWGRISTSAHVLWRLVCGGKKNQKPTHKINMWRWPLADVWQKQEYLAWRRKFFWQ